MSVYHFTDTARLPWILDTGELRPSKIATQSGYPEDFVWATTRDDGSLSASALYRTVFGYREGRTWLVRFTLPDEQFLPWLTVGERDPAWEPADLQRFKEGAQGDDAADWRVHSGPLGRADWLAIHARSYDNPTWRQMPLDLPVQTGTHSGGLPVKTIFWRARAFSSMCVREKPTRAYEFAIADMLGGLMAA